jgi:mannose-6-phosphate isomerase-like protein (cupin superfamily)
MFEVYQLPQGKIVFSCTTKNLSTGALYLNPQQELVKHNRPATEQLVQLAGTSSIELFDGETVVDEVTLNENETLTIPANQFHIHRNPTAEISVTMWKFEGDILEVIQKIRDSNQKIL